MSDKKRIVYKAPQKAAMVDGQVELPLISLSVIFFGIGLFLTAFVIHILIWRIVKPSKQMLWLTIVFIVLPICGWIIFSTLTGAHSEDGRGGLPLP